MQAQMDGCVRLFHMAQYNSKRTMSYSGVVCHIPGFRPAVSSNFVTLKWNLPWHFWWRAQTYSLDAAATADVDDDLLDVVTDLPRCPMDQFGWNECCRKQYRRQMLRCYESRANVIVCVCVEWHLFLLLQMNSVCTKTHAFHCHFSLVKIVPGCVESDCVGLDRYDVIPRPSHQTPRCYLVHPPPIIVR